MKTFLFFGVLCVVAGACQSTKTLNNTTRSKKAQPVQTGITGTVWLAQGNQMPDPRKEGPSQPGLPYATQVYFYEPTTLEQTNRPEYAPLFISINTRLVATVDSDSTGQFKATLPPGRYSVFVRHKDRFFANQYDLRNNIQLVTVDPGKKSLCNILVNSDVAH